jgi:hypothetical protein
MRGYQLEVVGQGRSVSQPVLRLHRKIYRPCPMMRTTHTALRLNQRFVNHAKAAPDSRSAFFTSRQDSFSLATLRDRFLVELAQPDGEQQHIEEDQSTQHRDHGKVRVLRHQRAAQTLARINQRI